MPGRLCACGPSLELCCSTHCAAPQALPRERAFVLHYQQGQVWVCAARHCPDLPVPSGRFNKGLFAAPQVLWDYLNGRILLGQSKEMEMQVGLLAVFQHWAKVEQEDSAPSRYVWQRGSLSVLAIGTTGVRDRYLEVLSG